MALHLRLVATLQDDQLVLTMLDGREHSRIFVDDGMDAAGLELYELGAVPARLLWSLEELDAALDRNGYARTTPWRFGPTAEITRVD
ncbi:hypothetical protein [Kineococcus sp. SYSU DK003]|uniref:hypothetical protein n=1 Tax=Kineococcus sp. SYSU DK003 TaxID=3383124 RepID=UPI003D7D1E4C